MGLGIPELIVILFLVILIFGASRLPELAKSVGVSMKEFKKATREVTDEIQNAAEDTTPPPRKLPPSGATAQADPQSSSTAPKA